METANGISQLNDMQAVVLYTDHYYFLNKVQGIHLCDDEFIEPIW